jgi:protein SCO1/2
MKRGKAAVFCSVLVLWSGITSSQNVPPSALTQVSFEQHLNAQVTLRTNFRDETGGLVELGKYFGSKPVVLILGYYKCPMLCSVVMNGFLESARGLKAVIGEDFEVVAVSIDPAEDAGLAAAKKASCVRKYGRPASAAGWHFLTGDERAIRQLASEAGFGYAYDPLSRQFAHASGFVVLTPSGRISRYFFGIEYRPTELAQALVASKANKISSPVERVLLLCFRYLPISGKYSGAVMVGVRVMGALTLAVLLMGVFRMLRRERRGKVEVAG